MAEYPSQDLATQIWYYDKYQIALRNHVPVEQRKEMRFLSVKLAEWFAGGWSCYGVSCVLLEACLRDGRLTLRWARPRSLISLGR